MKEPPISRVITNEINQRKGMAKDSGNYSRNGRLKAQINKLLAAALFLLILTGCSKDVYSQQRVVATIVTGLFSVEGAKAYLVRANSTVEMINRTFWDGNPIRYYVHLPEVDTDIMSHNFEISGGSVVMKISGKQKRKIYSLIEKLVETEENEDRSSAYNDGSDVKVFIDGKRYWSWYSSEIPTEEEYLREIKRFGRTDYNNDVLYLLYEVERVFEDIESQDKGKTINSQLRN